MKTSRTHIEMYHRCPRERYYSAHYSGQGVQRKGFILPLAAGIVMHQGFAELLTGRAIHDIIPDLRKALHSEIQKVEGLPSYLLDEQMAWIEGALRGWKHVRLPQILSDYDVIENTVEKEYVIQLSEGLYQSLRFDAILRNKTTGFLHLLDFKSTSTGGQMFLQQYEHNDQVQSYCKALEALSGERVGSFLIEGIIKGQYSNDRGKTSNYFGMPIQHSPYCYGFTKFGTEYRLVGAKGWDKIRSWESMPISDWLREVITHEKLPDLFVQTEVFPNPEELEDWQTQTVLQETHIKEGLDRLLQLKLPRDMELERYTLNRYFPQHKQNCFRYGGKPCPFLDACFDSSVRIDLIGSGIYEEREDHHGQ